MRERRRHRRHGKGHWVAIFSGLALFVGILVFVDLDPDRPEVTRMAAVSLLMATWWITEALPLAATALLPLVFFPLLGIMDGKEVSGLYVNYVVFLFIGGFMVALAIERWDLHKRIALHVLKRIGVEPRRVLLGFMAATAFLSMWISNTATAMMMVPIAMSVIYSLSLSLEEDKVVPYSKAIFLGIAYAASIGGIATLIGTPPNMVFAGVIKNVFPSAPEISFARWFVFGFPLSVTFLLICWMILFRYFRLHRMRIDIDRDLFAGQLRALGPMSTAERRVLTAAVALAASWIFRSDIRLGAVTIPGWSHVLDLYLGEGAFGLVTDGTVAIAVALLLFVIPSGEEGGTKLLDWPTAVMVPWDIVLLFGGGFALAAGFASTGLSEWLGLQLGGLTQVHPLILVACICIVATFLTELTSNTGTTQILLPIMASAALAIAVNPLFLMIPATLSCSFAFMLPVATPPNAIIFGTGNVQVRDMARAGILLNLIGIAIVTIGMYVYGRPVFGIDLSVLPEWAGM